MKLSFRYLAACALMALVPAFTAAGAETAIVGSWLGTLSVPGAQLRVVFNISRSSSGALSATMDSPDQGARDIPIDTTTFASGHLHLVSTAMSGTFEGDWSEDKTTLVGKWTQGGASLPLSLERSERAPEPVRPQEPKPPLPYDEQEVSFPNSSAGITFGGTLTLPRTHGPFPAVLLITGSGAEDRNEALMGHKPFLVLADYLTRRGIAVLRVDDRGTGKSTGVFKGSTTRDFAGDVLAGVAYLKGLSTIDSHSIGLIGHSEGGLIAPMAALESPDVAFIVLMAGPGITGEQILYLQSALIAKADGASDEMIATDRAIMEKAFAVAMYVADSAEAAKQLQQVIADAISQLTDEEKKSPMFSPEAIQESMKPLLSPWMRYFLAYDPVPTLKQVKCPVLAINGEKDLQVPPKENLKAIDQALKGGGNKDYAVKELPGLNHLFQTCKTGSPMEYGQIEETISPVALGAMGDWILAHAKMR